MPRDHCSPDETSASNCMAPSPVVCESKITVREPATVLRDPARLVPSSRHASFAECGTVRVQSESASAASGAKSGFADRRGLLKPDRSVCTSLDSADAATADHEIIPLKLREEALNGSSVRF